MNPTDKRFWTVIAIFIVIGGLILWDGHQRAYAPGNASTAASSSDSMAMAASTGMAMDASSTPVFTYACDMGKSITATLHLPADDFANVHLSDGRSLILSHAVSADGARYTNADESFVFWTKGNGAFVIENGTTTYADCVTNG